ncbi:carboxypeptidase-like regulatory domain-containing protein [Flavobacterium jejuense]|uniref:Carboxypeptidase-like regulatory domain-containing protein n=1 Tax=Flavobacterium jejuense TaxID=1544455 RepID=A0ABX0IP51_9FLAO|nr:carboxypeptidase-like regulatory domain-containing protein [Flavobacterium jejuense]NHN25597.1 carboxypeptidase-like regulatory domain-containing protein [Flavobacterium jejuense]
MKQKRLLTLFLLLITFFLSAQVKGIVKDSLTGKPISFVNIWVENENIGTTSEIDGTFLLDIKEEKNIIFSAIGFKTKNVKSTAIENVQLVGKVYDLNEVVLTSSKKTKQIKIGNYDASGFRYRLDFNSNAVFFEATEDVLKHPYLKEIKFHTISDIDKAIIRIRILESNVDKTPGDDIINEEIIVEVKKGSKANKKDFTDLNIKIPENGFYIVFEKLLIEENKYYSERTYKDNLGNKYKRKEFSYQPNLAYVPSEENNFCYSPNSTNWKRRSKIELKKPKSYENLLMRKYHNKYLIPSLEIIMSN